MRAVHLPCRGPAECLALEEAWLEEVEAGGGERLVFWESPVPAVVVGYGQAVDREVERSRCEADGVAILRR
ncbi:MAG: lipoyl protein ligase domain-containing protein, partial [Verrucomicrobiota bacterium]